MCICYVDSSNLMWNNMNVQKGLAIKTSASLLLVIFISSQLIIKTESKSLQKRSIFQLCTLINYYTNRSCTDYNDYGCFCGYGQEGRKAVDKTDACCRKHDNCYGRSSCFLYPQFVNFGFECDDSIRKCHCTDPRGSCRRRACECEMNLAECLSWATYNNNFYHMDRSVCK